MTQHIEFQNAKAEVFSFTEAGGVKEYHVMLHVTDYTLTFQQQLDAILDAYQSVITNTLPGAVTVFKRFFLSDSANQADDVAAADTSDCAKSIIQQAPLDGTKIGLWAYLMTDVASRLLPSELYEVSHGAYRHLWNGSAHNLAANSEYQTRLLFNLNYGGVVRARNQVFFTQGLTNSSHFIASTGIGGRQQDPNVLTQMDNYAIAGIKPEQIRYLYAPTHLNRTSDYGVSFERGTRLDYGDRSHVFISGTASINNKGQVVFPKDVVKQTHRMWENVEALLSEAECTFDDVAHIIVYLRDGSDYAVVSKLFQERFSNKPYIIVQASVCRQDWLIEMECMAVKKNANAAFEAL